MAVSSRALQTSDPTLIALHDVVEEFGYRVDAGNQQMIPGPGTGDIEQVALTRGEDGTFVGTIRTLSFNVKARLIPAEASSNEKAPDLRVLVGHVELGAAWRRTSRENTEYHSVKLDDPSFAAPIYANLVEGETDYALVWSR